MASVPLAIMSFVPILIILKPDEGSSASKGSKQVWKGRFRPEKEKANPRPKPEAAYSGKVPNEAKTAPAQSSSEDDQVNTADQGEVSEKNSSA